MSHLPQALHCPLQGLMMYSSILTLMIVAAGEEHEGGGDASQESLICPLNSEYFTEQATEDGGAQELNN